MKGRPTVIRTSLKAGCVLVTSLLFACANNGDVPLSSAPATPVEAPPTDSLERAVVAAAAPILHGMNGETPFEHGTLVEHGSSEHTIVLERGRCYRIVAAGAPTISDLDLALFDSSGVAVQRDTRHDSVAMVGAADAVCPQEHGAYRLEASAASGQGAFALRLFASAH
ncbi:MAG: hypothetical protein IPK60_23485 [Sandaracinaceae bacterium]|jgi:hypothetical protein|nr:hypothetical protein [Sandaracinaceae bacterium]